MPQTQSELGLTAAAPTPDTLWLELTPSYNLHCVFCYNPWRSEPKAAHPATLPHNEYVALVTRLVSRRRFSYVALSGEPLLYTELPALVEALRRNGQHSVLTTNGCLLNRDRLTLLVNAGLSGLQVPVLAATPALHDRLSGRPSWEQAIHALALGRSRLVYVCNFYRHCRKH
jgi:MoaA/NifB/PqqE/SkfB family radical SAM enzyme